MYHRFLIAFLKTHYYSISLATRRSCYRWVELGSGSYIDFYVGFNNLFTWQMSLFCLSISLVHLLMFQYKWLGCWLELQMSFECCCYTSSTQHMNIVYNLRKISMCVQVCFSQYIKDYHQEPTQFPNTKPRLRYQYPGICFCN